MKPSKILLCIVIITALAPLVVSQTCVFKFNDTSSGARKLLDCNYKDCWIEIYPTSTETIQLRIATMSSHKFQVYTFSTSLNKTRALKGTTNKTRTFFSGPGDGLRFKRLSGNCDSKYKAGFEFKFVPSDLSVCNPLVSYIGTEKVKVVQSRKTIKIGDSCPYRLIPENTQSNFSETLFLLSPNNVSLSAIINGDENELEKGKTIIVENWRTVDFRMDYDTPERYETTQVDPIYAVSTAKSCACNMEERLSSTSFTFTSPGYPDFLCPSLYCKTIVKFPARTFITSDFLERKLVTISAQSRKGVTLQLKSALFNLELNERTFTALNTTFIAGEHDIFMSFKTSQQLYIGEKGHYKVDIEQITIPQNCDCTVFYQKNYGGQYRKSIIIPSHCEVVFCDYTLIPNNQGMNKEVTIYLENGQSGDQVQIWNREFVELYDHEKLKNPRKLYIGDFTSDAHIFFHRKSKGENATLHLQFHNEYMKEICELEVYELDTVPIAITSQNYPMPYVSGECRILLEAPEDYYVSVLLTDLHLENFHDDLSFYDGDTIDSNKLQHLSGIHSNIVINSTGQFMIAELIADDHDSKKGFHFVAVAVPKSDFKTAAETGSEDFSFNWHEFNEEPLGMKIKQNILNNQRVSVPADAPDHSNETETTTTFEPQSLSSNTSVRAFFRNQIPRTGQTHMVMISFVILALLLGSVIGVRAGYAYLKKRLSDTNISNSFQNANVRFRSEDNDSMITIETGN